MTRRAISGSYLALWLATAAGAALASAGVHVIRAAAPRDALEPSLDTASALLAHNALVALWPLALVAIGWPALAGARAVGDALIAAQLLSHGLIVGGAARPAARALALPAAPAAGMARARDPRRRLADRASSPRTPSRNDDRASPPAPASLRCSAPRRSRPTWSP